MQDGACSQSLENSFQHSDKHQNSLAFEMTRFTSKRQTYSKLLLTNKYEMYTEQFSNTNKPNYSSTV